MWTYKKRIIQGLMMLLLVGVGASGGGSWS